MSLAAIIPADPAQPMTLEHLDGLGSFLHHLGTLQLEAIEGEDFIAYMGQPQADTPQPVNPRAERFINDQTPEGNCGDPITGTVVVLGPMDEDDEDTDLPETAAGALGLAY